MAPLKKTKRKDNEAILKKNPQRIRREPLKKKNENALSYR